MTRLRLYVSDHSEQNIEWVLYDADQRQLHSGRGMNWPHGREQFAEVIIPAGWTRIVRLHLPPLTGARLDAAAKYALEEQLAGELDDHHIVVKPHEGEAGCLVHIVQKKRLRKLLQILAEQRIRVARVIAENQLLAPQPAIWQWVVRAQEGFLVASDGTSYVLDYDLSSADLPITLQRALSAAHIKPKTIVVYGPAELTPRLAEWQSQLEQSFTRADPWSWRVKADFIRATNLLSGEFAPVSETPVPNRYKFAVGLLFGAVALHIVASGGYWLHLVWQKWHLQNELNEVYRVSSAQTFAHAKAEWWLRYRQHQHAALQTAPDDAWPMLARLAESLEGKASLRSVNYENHQLTVEFVALTEQSLQSIQTQLRAQGMASVTANTGSITRMRVYWNP